jgi:hypothetical protein
LVRKYVGAEHLPVIGQAMRQHGLAETTFEEQYEHLGPWMRQDAQRRAKPLHRFTCIGQRGASRTRRWHVS